MNHRNHFNARMSKSPAVILREDPGPSRRTPIAATTILLVSLALFSTACSNQKPAAISAPETVSGITLFTAQRTIVPDYMDATGTVRAADSAQLASQMMGTITHVHVHEGDHIRRGEVLISIDAAQPRAAFQNATAGVQASDQGIAAADAEYSLAEATMRRYQMLYDKKSVSPQEFDEVKTKLAAAKAHRDAAHAGRAQAEASLSEANTVVGFSSIRAPFNGVVTAKLADVGAMAAPGVPLLTVEDPSHFRLEVQVDESQMGAVHLGAAIPVVIDALGDPAISGKVIQIAAAANPSSRSVTVKIELPPNPQIRSGLFGRAQFPRGQRPSILVPQAALVHRGQLDAVYVVDKDQIASLRYITLGKPSAKDVDVLSGLDSGERVVADAGGRDLSGKRIGAQ